jgi:general secretion pathway protein K
MQRPDNGQAMQVAVPAGQRGVALAIVVWFIAGMSLLVAGIVAHARVDTHMAQVHVARAKAVAAGDGAIQLMMVDLMTGRRDAAELPRGNYRLGDVEVTVVMVPASGLIDINKAPVDVLVALFELAGKLDDEAARLLAGNVVQSRTTRPGPAGVAGGSRLDAIEDLLRIPGSSRTLLDSVRDFIVVGKSGQGAVNWSQAPEAVLEVLGRANPAQADTVRARRGSAAASYPRAPGAASRAAGMASAYRADALVRYGDKIWLRRRWIAIERSPSTALPWHATRTEPPRVLMKDSYLPGGSVDA